MLIPHRLSILMWRHMKEKKHRIWHTVVTIGSGVLVFFIIFLLRQVLLLVYSQERTQNNNHKTLDLLLYSPNNAATQNLMRKATDVFNPNNPFAYKDSSRQILRGFKNETEVNNYLYSSHLNHTVGILNFQNVFKESNGLRYSIRTMKPLKSYVDSTSRVSSNMEILFKEVFSPEMSENPSVITKLQWAVNKAYLEDLSGSRIFHELNTVVLSNKITEDLKKIYEYLVICSIVGPLPYFLFNASRLVEEKRSGLRELLKLVGVSPNILRISHLLMTVILGSVYGLLIALLLKVTNKPILPYSNGAVVGITIILHFLNITSLTFVTSIFSQDYQHSGGVSLLVYLFTYLLDTLFHHYRLTKPYIYIVMMFLPHASIYAFWDEVTHMEKIGQGIHFLNLILSDDDCISVLIIWICCLIQLVFLLTVAWYLDLVRPGRYGVAKKWNFIFKKSFWSRKKKKVTFHATSEYGVKLLRDDRFFEKPPKHAEIAIKMVKVTKVFQGFKQPKLVALDTVSLDIYKGEVAVLLGANGAGKTTLLSIITGMYSATSGNVYVNGLDAKARIREIRKDLGLCPQDNLTFKYLTVKENIILFESLKGNIKDARSSAEHLMMKLKLNDKDSHYSYQLSTGMKRCLQVACAMAGGAEVLVLDEPTSGMDQESRHSLWDLILSIRGDTTILMTTAFLDEADALGDRIALLNCGKLKCYGTPAFLKKAIGSGFNLALTLRHKRNIAPVEKIVRDKIPESTTDRVERKRIAFILPTMEQNLFPDLFDILEEGRNELGIISMEVGMSMENVFLSFIEDENEDQIAQSKIHLELRDDFLQDIKLKGWRLRLQQFRYLLKRNFIFLWSKKYQFIFLQIFVPVIGMLIVTYMSNNEATLGSVTSHNRFDTNVTALYNQGPLKRSRLDPITKIGRNVKVVWARNISRVMNKFLKYHNNKKISNVFGIEMTNNLTKIYIFDADLNLLPNIINLFSNLYLTTQTPYLKSYIALDYDKSYLRSTNQNPVQPKSAVLLSSWSIWVVFFVILSLAPFVWLSVSELSKGVKPGSTARGCECVWRAAQICAHAATFLASVPAPLAGAVLSLEYDRTIDQPRFLVALMIHLIIFGLAFLSHLYSLSFILSENNALYQIYIMSLILALIVPSLVGVLAAIPRHLHWLWYMNIMIQVISYFSPIFTFSMSLDNIAHVARMNAHCRINRHLCPNIQVTKFFDNERRKICCAASSSETPFSYYLLAQGSFQLELLIVHFVFYFNPNFLMCNHSDTAQPIWMKFSPQWLSVVLLYRRPYLYAERVVNWRYTCNSPAHTFHDPNVIKEKTHVTDTIEYCKTRKVADLWIAANLHKNYVQNFTRRCNAVKGVSFSVKSGECLGILGPNSAGKTTTLSMIAGFTAMTRGDAYMDGYFLSNNSEQYMQCVGFTPATGGFDEFLSGFENLKLLSLLLGLPPHSAELWASKCLRFMGMQYEGSSPVHTYSAGGWRRLRCAAALVRGARAVALDEPAAHTDHAGRAAVVSALRHLRACGAALVVAEQSMDWRDMQSVFTNIAIMLKGELAAFGPAREIHDALALGITARLKIKQESVLKFKKTLSDDLKPQIIENKTERLKSLKEDFKKHFPTSILASEHLSIINYQIKEIQKKLLYSDVFTKLEILKSEFSDILEDYTFRETTIGEVFYKLEKGVEMKDSDDEDSGKQPSGIGNIEQEQPRAGSSRNEELERGTSQNEET